MWRERAEHRAAKQGNGRERYSVTQVVASLIAWMVCLGLAALLAGAGLGAPVALAAAQAPRSQRPPGGNFADPVVRAVDIAQPAVVRIETEEHATLTLQLCTRAVNLPLSGGPYHLGLLGTGAFISAHGDILTADHVVDVPDFEVAAFAAQDIAAVLSNQTNFDPGCPGNLPVSASDVASGAVNFSYTAHVSGVRTLAWMSTGYSGPLAATTLSNVARQDATKTVASSYNNDDLAVLHVNMDDTPSVRLDDSAVVAVQDQLTVIGFPGNGDVNNNATNLLTPSINQVMVNAIKTGDNGSALIQVGGNVEHGDSGAPVLDSAGHIVGVVSFGGIADALGDTTFLRTSDSALNLLSGQSIDVAPGPFEQLWTKAFSDYAATYAGHWKAAAREMATLANRYPQFQALTPYLTYAQAAAATESVPSRSSGAPALPLAALLGAAGVLVLLAGLGVGLWLLVRSRRKPAPAVATARMTGMVGMTPYLPAPGYPVQPMPGQPLLSYPALPPTLLPQPPMPYPSYPYPPQFGAGTIPPGQGMPGQSRPGMATGVFGRGGNGVPSGAIGAPGYAPPAFAPAGGPAGEFGQAWPAVPMHLCANGHPVAAADTFCPWCGATVRPAAEHDAASTPAPANQ
ncbi:MAG TPA: serine protease [Ktedonobacterales bacterium]|nr:serine protease [Ktedonobacterales bacterium]